MTHTLSFSGMASESFLHELDYDFVTSELFFKGEVVKSAADASHLWVDVLHPHLALMQECTDSPACFSLPAHERMFQHDLEKVLYKALLLEARLRVAGGYHISQHKHSSHSQECLWSVYMRQTTKTSWWC